MHSSWRKTSTVQTGGNRKEGAEHREVCCIFLRLTFSGPCKARYRHSRIAALSKKLSSQTFLGQKDPKPRVLQNSRTSLQGLPLALSANMSLRLARSCLGFGTRVWADGLALPLWCVHQGGGAGCLLPPGTQTLLPGGSALPRGVGWAEGWAKTSRAHRGLCYQVVLLVLGWDHGTPRDVPLRHESLAHGLLTDKAQGCEHQT